MRSHGMPVRQVVVALLLAGCVSAVPSRPKAPRPLGLPDDIDVEADRRTVHHTRSGGGAMVDRVLLSVRNRSDRARRLNIAGVDRLHGSCDALAWDDIRPLEVLAPARPVHIGPGEALGLAVVFDPVECYNACDRFGFRVHLELDDRPVIIDALLDVQREE